jgi:hypothetical protein
MQHKKELSKKYFPSEPCTCEICVGYCIRPGWWTVKEAAAAFHAGYANRMMLEIAPDRSFGVLSPAFQGCEGSFALQIYAKRGCNFLKAQRCELFGSGYEPLECRVCHHARPGLGPECHAEIEKEWAAPEGRALVVRWTRKMGLWKYLETYGLGQLQKG